MAGKGRPFPKGHVPHNRTPRVGLTVDSLEHEAHRNFLADRQREHAGRTVSEDSQSLSGFPADCP